MTAKRASKPFAVTLASSALADDFTASMSSHMLPVESMTNARSRRDPPAPPDTLCTSLLGTVGLLNNSCASAA